MAEMLLALALVLACAPGFVRSSPRTHPLAWAASKVSAVVAWIDKMDDAIYQRRSMFDSWSRLAGHDQHRLPDGRRR